MTWGTIFSKKGKNLMVSNIGLSKDGSAMVINNQEKQAICHFCKTIKEFSLPAIGALNSPIVYNKPQKWAVVFGGTRREPKRFFICDGCAKLMVSKHIR